MELIDKMGSLLLKSRAVNTVKKYDSGFGRWQVFITSRGGNVFPASPIHIALYLTHLIDTGSSFSVVSSAKYSIKWMHEINGYKDPTDNPFVKNLLETSKRVCYRPVGKKDPVSTQMLIDLCIKYKYSLDLAVVRDLAMIVICYAGFFRFDELSSLRCNDISFNVDHLSIKLHKSKTDQYRLGDVVVIAKGDTEACPYKMLRRYFMVAGMYVASSKYLFRPIFRSRAICKLIYKDKKLSYTRARECIVKRLKEVTGFLNIGLHSLRSGGASTAANAQVNERCFKRHGRWKSENAKDGYIADSLESRLLVTKKLNL